jgi:DNA (cytosine-5)-methyltransferase 1
MAADCPVAYYNENDPFAAAWLMKLIDNDLIAPGWVDTRSIEDVLPEDLDGFTQCHFFAGIGGWSYALRLAGWPDDREVWTGSCPCPSFSCAGKGQGFDDPRHLWPEFYRLIRESKPPAVFGEQSANAIGHGWWDLVSTDLEGEGYAVGAAVLASASVGATDIRHRLYFVGLANSADSRCSGAREHGSGSPLFSARSEQCGRTGGMEHTKRTRLEGLAGDGDDGHQPGWFGAGATGSVRPTGEVERMADANNSERRSDLARGNDGNGNPTGRHESDGESRTGRYGQFSNPFADALKGFWGDADWLLCTDGRWRPVEAGTFPLDYGIPNRLGRDGDSGTSTTQGKSEARLMRLRGYGNAINAQVAKEFILANMHAMQDT